jgi:predicted lipoprotein with Yx(FWY)xxD motif
MRTLALLAALALVPLAAASSAATVKVGTINGTGRVVVTGRGLTLYHVASETKGAVNCAGACTKIWIPLTANGNPTAGRGLDAKKLGTRKRPDGIVQVTYFGYGLYRYANDAKPGDARSQGLGGNWFAVTPAGAVTTAATNPDCPPGQAMTGADDGNDPDDHGGAGDGDGCI